MALMLATMAVAVGVPSCDRSYSQAEHAEYVEAVYHRPHVRRPARRRMATMARCARSPEATSNMRSLQRREGRSRRQRARIESITPYSCSFGRFAIPCGVVACESHGFWSSVNRSSGAIGPYQFLGWPVPWPVRSEADKLAHHRMARKLWNGGAGAGHWAQCL